MIELRWQKIHDAECMSVVLRCDMADVDGCPRSIGHHNAVLARRDAVVLGWQDGDVDLCPTHGGGAR